MADENFINKYSELVNFFKAVTELMIANDKFYGIVYDLPDPTNKESYYLSSEDEQLENSYLRFYNIRKRLYLVAERTFEKYNAYLEEDKYQTLSSVINDILNTLLPILNQQNMADIYPSRNELLTKSGIWKKELGSVKDTIADDLRFLTNKQSDQPKKDLDTDSQTVSDLRNTAGARILDPAMATISTKKKVVDDIELRTKEVVDKISLLKYVNKAFDSISDSKLLENVHSNIESFVDKFPNWLKVVVRGPSSVTRVTTEDEQIAKKSVQSILLNYNVRSSEPISEDQKKILDHWRKVVRKRFGDYPFCDEASEKVDGEWVLKDDASYKILLERSKKKLLEKLGSSLPRNQ